MRLLSGDNNLSTFARLSSEHRCGMTTYFQEHSVSKRERRLTLQGTDGTAFEKRTKRTRA